MTIMMATPATKPPICAAQAICLAAAPGIPVNPIATEIPTQITAAGQKRKLRCPHWLGRAINHSTAPNKPLIDPEAPTTGTLLSGNKAKCVNAPATPETKKIMSIRRRPAARSNADPNAANITMFNPRCSQPPWRN